MNNAQACLAYLAAAMRPGHATETSYSGLNFLNPADTEHNSTQSFAKLSLTRKRYMTFHIYTFQADGGDVLIHDVSVMRLWRRSLRSRKSTRQSPSCGRSSFIIQKLSADSHEAGHYHAPGGLCTSPE